MSDKSDAMNRLYRGIDHDSRFDKLRYWTSGIRLVPGVGNLNSSIVFVGEAPGAQENEAGKPFVGRAGDILNEMLAESGIDRNRVFITNAVKFRPQSNRTPSRAELNVARGYLVMELSIIQPSVVVLMGASAIKAVWMTGHAPTLNNAHGSIVDADGYPWKFCLLYHPMALMHNGTKDIGLDDMRGLRHWCDMHDIPV